MCLDLSELFRLRMRLLDGYTAMNSLTPKAQVPSSAVLPLSLPSSKFSEPNRNGDPEILIIDIQGTAMYSDITCSGSNGGNIGSEMDGVHGSEMKPLSDKYMLTSGRGNKRRRTLLDKENYLENVENNDNVHYDDEEIANMVPWGYITWQTVDNYTSSCSSSSNSSSGGSSSNYSISSSIGRSIPGSLKLSVGYNIVDGHTPKTKKNCTRVILRFTKIEHKDFGSPISSRNCYGKYGWEVVGKCSHSVVFEERPVLHSSFIKLSQHGDKNAIIAASTAATNNSNGSSSSATKISNSISTDNGSIKCPNDYQHADNASSTAAVCSATSSNAPTESMTHCYYLFSGCITVAEEDYTRGNTSSTSSSGSGDSSYSSSNNYRVLETDCDVETDLLRGLRLSFKTNAIFNQKTVYGNNNTSDDVVCSAFSLPLCLCSTTSLYAVTRNPQDGCLLIGVTFNGNVGSNSSSNNKNSSTNVIMDGISILAVSGYVLKTNALPSMALVYIQPQLYLHAVSTPKRYDHYYSKYENTNSENSDSSAISNGNSSIGVLLGARTSDLLHNVQCGLLDIIHYLYGYNLITYNRLIFNKNAFTDATPLPVCEEGDAAFPLYLLPHSSQHCPLLMAPSALSSSPSSLTHTFIRPRHQQKVVYNTSNNNSNCNEYVFMSYLDSTHANNNNNYLYINGNWLYVSVLNIYKYIKHIMDISAAHSVIWENHDTSTTMHAHRNDNTNNRVPGLQIIRKCHANNQEGLAMNGNGSGMSNSNSNAGKRLVGVYDVDVINRVCDALIEHKIGDFRQTNSKTNNKNHALNSSGSSNNKISSDNSSTIDDGKNRNCADFNVDAQRLGVCTEADEGVVYVDNSNGDNQNIWWVHSNSSGSCSSGSNEDSIYNDNGTLCLKAGIVYQLLNRVGDCWLDFSTPITTTHGSSSSNSSRRGAKRHRSCSTVVMPWLLNHSRYRVFVGDSESISNIINNAVCCVPDAIIHSNNGCNITSGSSNKCQDSSSSSKCENSSSSNSGSGNIDEDFGLFRFERPDNSGRCSTNSSNGINNVRLIDNTVERNSGICGALSYYYNNCFNIKINGDLNDVGSGSRCTGGTGSSGCGDGAGSVAESAGFDDYAKELIDSFDSYLDFIDSDDIYVNLNNSNFKPSDEQAATHSDCISSSTNGRLQYRLNLYKLHQLVAIAAMEKLSVISDNDENELNGSSRTCANNNSYRTSARMEDNSSNNNNGHKFGYNSCTSHNSLKLILENNYYNNNNNRSTSKGVELADYLKVVSGMLGELPMEAAYTWKSCYADYYKDNTTEDGDNAETDEDEVSAEIPAGASSNSSNSENGNCSRFNSKLLRDITHGFPDIRNPKHMNYQNILFDHLCKNDGGSNSTTNDEDENNSPTVLLRNINNSKTFNQLINNVSVSDINRYMALNISVLKGYAYFDKYGGRLHYLPHFYLPINLRERLVVLFGVKDSWCEEELYYYLHTLVDINRKSNGNISSDSSCNSNSGHYGVYNTTTYPKEIFIGDNTSYNINAIIVNCLKAATNSSIDIKGVLSGSPFEHCRTSIEQFIHKRRHANNNKTNNSSNANSGSSNYSVSDEEQLCVFHNWNLPLVAKWEVVT